MMTPADPDPAAAPVDAPATTAPAAAPEPTSPAALASPAAPTSDPAPAPATAPAPADAQVPAAPPAPVGWVWTAARVAARTFYRIERLGGTLPDGALLLVANHPNTLVDPVLIQTTAGRQVRFLAKSTLFADHLVSPLVRRSGAIPVYRRIDPGVDVARNVEMFAAVEAALAAGGAICLFPEGISHARGRLEPLRTGAARMVLASAAAGHPVTIVPVGLNFERLARFRSRVTVVFGRPFDGADLGAAFAADEAAAVRTLTDRIEQRLRRLLVEADPQRDLRTVRRVDRLYAAARGASRDPADRIARRQRIADGLDALRRDDPDRLADLTARVDEYDARLRRVGLRDPDVDRRIPVGAAVRFAVRDALPALLLAPVALASLVVFAAPYWMTGRVSRRAPDIESRATWQLIGGAVVYGVWIAGLAGAAGAGAGPGAGALTGVGLIGLAFAGVRAVERAAAVLRALRTFVALRQAPARTRVGLRRERAALADLLDEVRAWIDRRAAP